MALSNLLASMEAEAAEEAARVDAESRAEADGIIEAAQVEARTLREQASQAAESEARQEADQRRARARLEAAAILREAREEAQQGLLTVLREQLVSVRDRADYRQVLRALIRECVAALPAGTILRIDPRDERLAGELVSDLDAGLQIAATLATTGGVELATGDGRTARNTIEERLANAEPALRLLLGDMLAGLAQARAEREPERAEAR